MHASFHVAALSAVVLFTSATVAHAASIVSTFDDLPLAPNSFYAPGASTPFTSGAATFNHDYNADWGSWSGWAYSNTTDTTSGDFTNQYSAYAGGGADGSAHYAVAYVGAPVITFAAPTVVESVFITNTTYAALSMLNGDFFAKAFGGASGDDPDWFALTITGHDAAGDATGTVDFHLADYRFADNSLDYVVTDWTLVDLSALGTVSSLTFSLSSSDVGDFGMNTPAYFALDNLSVAAVPEPSTWWMMGLGLAALGFAARRRSA